MPYLPALPLDSPGIEVAVTVVDEPDGPRALPAVEIDAKSGFSDYAARYTAGLATARLTAPAAAAVAELAVGAHRLLRLRDVSRTDAVVTPDGVAHFLEVNVRPGSPRHHCCRWRSNPTARSWVQCSPS